MNTEGPTEIFNEHNVLHKLKHYLPTQAPLKDFIHHNTLHAFQNEKFHKGLHKASKIFGYKTYLRLDEYRGLYKEGKISPDAIKNAIAKTKGPENLIEWENILHNELLEVNIKSRIGKLRDEWKNVFKFNVSKQVHPFLFRFIGNYIDQGIAIDNFPVEEKGLLETIREMERVSSVKMFKSKRVKDLLFNDECTIHRLLSIIVGREDLFEQYLFDQQFEHAGWSGMVCFLEENPNALIAKRNLSLSDFIIFELLLEIDVLDTRFDENWAPLSHRISNLPLKLFEAIAPSKLFQTLEIWHNAMEWTYYDAVLSGISKGKTADHSIHENNSFQGIFCIDDRECSLRRYIESIDKKSKTFGTAGFFNVEFYFQPEGTQFYTKLCPAPVTPKFLIREVSHKAKVKSNVHFSKKTHGLLGGWFFSQTIGFFSAFKLFFNIFRPRVSAAMNYSFQHMNKDAVLQIEKQNSETTREGLQIGFTVEEMALRMEGLLKSIGLVKDFAPIVYIVGHGASSTNNTYYAGYDCGACCGRPGSVNARVAAYMANNLEVRKILASSGINIPDTTQFVGALQDTTRDEMEFYDTDNLNASNKLMHEANILIFNQALTLNAKERSRRFIMMNNKVNAKDLHEKVKIRSMSLFEPRPEYNHATNSLCIVGRRNVSEHLFLDRRSFLNSFDYNVDPEGKYLLNILKAVAPVCGGINLEYFFSRVDNQRLGAGSKLPHNVLGLIGVANGADGDLRTGLPQQMIEIHDPLRLMVIVEHFPEVIKSVLMQSEPTYEWFVNEWIHLIAIHPDTRQFYHFVDGEFVLYNPMREGKVISGDDLINLIETESGNIEPIILN